MNFRVHDLLKRWDTETPSVIRQAISKHIKGTSRIIVFVGDDTFMSYWVVEEVRMTLKEGKSVYAIKLKDTNGRIPKCLINNSIRVYEWSEQKLQSLATC